MNTKFRKRPVVIDAVQWQVGGLDTSLWPEWLIKAFEDNAFMDGDDDLLEIATLEGHMTVSPGNSIIRGVKAEEIYPCKPDIFKATYEPVSS